MQAAAVFAEGASAPQVASVLEVSTKSAYGWRRAWAAGGAAALLSKGRPGPPRRLSDAQLARLQARLDAGPAAAGYVTDQRWTLAPGSRAGGHPVSHPVESAGNLGIVAPHGLDAATAGPSCRRTR